MDFDSELTEEIHISFTGVQKRKLASLFRAGMKMREREVLLDTGLAKELVERLVGRIEGQIGQEHGLRLIQSDLVRCCILADEIVETVAQQARFGVSIRLSEFGISAAEMEDIRRDLRAEYVQSVDK